MLNFPFHRSSRQKHISIFLALSRNNFSHNFSRKSGFTEKLLHEEVFVKMREDLNYL